MSPKFQSRKDSPLLTVENLPESQAQRRIGVLRLRLRPYNALKSLGVDTIGQLLALSERELAKGRGMGRRCVEDIREALGVFLRPSTPTSSVACEPTASHTPSHETGGIDLAPPRPPDGPFIDRKDGKTAPRPDRRGAGKLRDWLIPESVCADLNAPVGRLGLSVRERAAMDRLGIETIRQLVDFSRPALLATRNFGGKSDAEIEAKLFAYLSEKGIFSPIDPHLGTVEFVNKLLSGRTEVQHKILCARYGFWDGQSKTLQHLGIEMGLSTERIRQIQHAALAQIRDFYGPELIGDFLSAKLAAYAKLNPYSTHGIERDGAVAIADGCSPRQASLVLKFLRDLKKA